MARSKANKNLHKLSPILHTTLVHLGMMPHREFKTPAELKAALDGIDQVIIDATERAYRRSQDNATQHEHYSGKKRGHRVKNTVCQPLINSLSFLAALSPGIITITPC